MKNRKSKQIILAVILLCFCSSIVYVFNIRLTPLAALKANSLIGEIEEVIGEVDIDGGKIYIVDTPEAFKTAMVEKYGPFWRSSVSFYCTKQKMSNDKLKTIGYMSYAKRNGQIQLLGVWNEDPQVSTIQVIGAKGELSTQLAPTQELILFQWDKTFNMNDATIVALDQEGKPLYRYGYPEGTNVFKDDELKWHAIIE